MNRYRLTVEDVINSGNEWRSEREGKLHRFFRATRESKHEDPEDLIYMMSVHIFTSTKFIKGKYRYPPKHIVKTVCNFEQISQEEIFLQLEDAVMAAYRQVVNHYNKEPIKSELHENELAIANSVGKKPVAD